MMRLLRAGVLATIVALAVGQMVRLGAAQAATAQAPAVNAADVALDRELPIDPAVRTGTLANGLRFFIRQNGRPAARVSLRLAVDAGSLQEEPDQRGLAHFLEHMAFNGTEHFKPGELVAFLESIGARFGPHVNASTSFDETIYMLDVPTDREGYVDKGLLALRDFAAGIELPPAEVEKERGVVLEEWRGRLGASARITDLQLPVLLQGSRYAERLPIGIPEVIKSAPRERMLAFYKKWYRPDRMAVVVVGDIDPAAAERLVRAQFDGIAKPSDPPGTVDRTIPPHTGDAVQPRDRPGGAGMDRDAQHQEPGTGAANGSRLPVGARAPAGRRDAGPPPGRDRAAAQGTVRRCRSRRRHVRPDAAAVRDQRRRPGERAGAGPRSRHARGAPRPAVRLHARRARIGRGALCSPPTSAPTTSAAPPRAGATRKSTSVTSWNGSRFRASSSSTGSRAPICRP